MKKDVHTPSLKKENKHASNPTKLRILLLVLRRFSPFLTQKEVAIEHHLREGDDQDQQEQRRQQDQRLKHLHLYVFCFSPFPVLLWFRELVQDESNETAKMFRNASALGPGNRER